MMRMVTAGGIGGALGNAAAGALGSFKPRRNKNKKKKGRK
jgi:hypothetical protein